MKQIFNAVRFQDLTLVEVVTIHVDGIYPEIVYTYYLHGKPYFKTYRNDTEDEDDDEYQEGDPIFHYTGRLTNPGCTRVNLTEIGEMLSQVVSKWEIKK